MRPSNYEGIIRILGIVSALVLWAIGVYFNRSGFVSMLSGMAWIGIILAVIFSFIEIIGNHEAARANMTFVIVWFAAYAYGLSANWLGITGAMNNQPNFPQGEWWFAAALTFFLEVVPEPLLVWGVTGAWSGGDFFAQIVNIARGRKFVPPVPQHGDRHTIVQPPKKQQQPQHQNVRHQQKPLQQPAKGGATHQTGVNFRAAGVSPAKRIEASGLPADVQARIRARMAQEGLLDED